MVFTEELVTNNEMIVAIISLVISSIAATGAIAAIFVSVWQTKWPYKVSLKIKTNILDYKYPGAGDTYWRYKKIWISIHNTGFTDASILSWGVCVDKKHMFNAQYFDKKPFSIKSKKLESKTIPLDLFQDPVNVVADGRLKNKRIRIFVQEMGGKYFYSKRSIKVSNLLAMESKDFRSTISEEEYEECFIQDVDFGPLKEYLSEKGFNNGK